MKKLLSFRILLFLFFGMMLSANPTPSYADAWAEQRSVCNWFRDRFAAYVRIKECPWWGATWCGGGTSTHCQYAEQLCDLSNVSGINSYAYAIATFDNLFATHYGNNGYCTGYDTRYLTNHFSLFPMIEGGNVGTKEVTLKVGKTTFDYANHTIILEDITGTLSIKDALDKANIFASFSIALSYDAESKGETMTTLDDKTYKSRLLWSSKAILNNGLIKMTGGYEGQAAKLADERTPFFKSNDFTVDKKEGKANLKIDKYVITLPKEIDLDKVVVGVGIDGGNFGFGISEKFSVEKAKSSLQIGDFYTPTEVFSFSNYPNPIADKTTVTIKLSANENVTLILYDKNGNVVKSLFNAEVKKGETFSQEIDLSGFPKDVYILKLVLKDKTLSRKLFIE